jgi:hypothetical protein
VTLNAGVPAASLSVPLSGTGVAALAGR